MRMMKLKILDIGNAMRAKRNLDFYDGTKCDNCKIDFPNLKDWIATDGSYNPIC